MNKFGALIDADDTVKSTFEKGAERLHELGVKAISYHLTPPFHSQISERTTVLFSGHSPDVMAATLDPKIFENNPLPDYVMHVGHSMSWSQALSAQNLSQGQADYVEDGKKLGLVDGIATPLFGPHGRNSFCSFSFDRKIISNDERLIKPLEELAQATHQRICLIIERDEGKTINISKRESEMLYWMARGKSNTDIATILGISSGTVDTYNRRLYAKLKVNDRISATIEGLSRGLVKI